MSAGATAGVGTELPPLEIPLTRTLIVACAIASRDYQDVHHDPDLARARGSSDIFLNILSSNGLAERYLRAWAGSRAVLSRLTVRLGAPAYPGDALRFSGRVTEVHDSVAGREVEVEVVAAVAAGDHLRGRARLRFPTAD